jgi:hypothetical protein
MDKLLKREPSLTQAQAFDRTSKPALTEFCKQLERLARDSDKTFSNVHIIFVDKNHPENGIAKTRQLILQNLPPVECKLLYLIPKITRPMKHSPFSLEFFL